MFQRTGIQSRPRIPSRQYARILETEKFTILGDYQRIRANRFQTVLLASLHLAAGHVDISSRVQINRAVVGIGRVQLAINHRQLTTTGQPDHLSDLSGDGNILQVRSTSNQTLLFGRPQIDSVLTAIYRRVLHRQLGFICNQDSRILDVREFGLFDRRLRVLVFNQ